MSSYRRRLILANQDENDICFYGNSVQSGIPAPDAPVDILNLENPIIKVDGESFVTIEGYTLKGIKKYKDRIYTKDGKVWFEQKSGIYTTDGNTVLESNGLTDYGLQARTNVLAEDKYKANGYAIQKADGDPGFSTHFKYSYKAYAGGMTDCAVFTGVRAWIITDNFTDITQANNWIKENKVTFIYPLTTPIITEITGEVAEKILAIDKAKNITISAPNGVSGTVEIVKE